MKRLIGLLLVSIFVVATAIADERLETTVRQYREALKEASPGELWVLMGEELYRKPRGPKNASLEACDFGPGVVKGAHAQLPRYFSDTGRVEDLESRLMTCMRQLQGFGEDAFPRHARGDPKMLDFERLAAYVAAQSNGMKLAAPLAHPKEIEAYRIGERLFHRRAGAYDFSCATCHTLEDKRIRLQRLAHLTQRNEAQTVFPSWPAYRVAPGEVHTMQDWLAICYWAARHPQLRYGSEASVALQVFMAQHANGGVISAPSVKR
jgi:L-cysteine S-thiosulfotransferase